MSLSEQTRLECLELAVDLKQRPARAGDERDLDLIHGQFCAFVGGDDPVRLGCLALAMKTHGGVPRCTTDQILAAAADYLYAVSSKTPRTSQPRASKRRGRKGQD